jgi:hypothetical protein
MTDASPAPEERRPADEKSKQLDTVRVDIQDTHLTTQHGVRLDDTDNSLKAGDAARRCWRTCPGGRRSPTSTTNASPSGSCTREEQGRTTTSGPTTTRWRSRAQRHGRRPAGRPRHEHDGVGALRRRGGARRVGERPGPQRRWSRGALRGGGVQARQAGGRLGEGADLLCTARVTKVRVARDDEPVMSGQGVVTSSAAQNALPADFLEEFASALGKHCAWERDTAPVPA